MYTKTEVDSLIPDSLSDLSDDSTHRLVTDTEKTAWSGKSVVSANPQSTTETLSGIEIDGTGYTFPGSSSVTGVKGSAEQNYRTGDVSISANNVGALGVVGNVTVSSLDDLVALCLNSGNNKAFEGPINISTDIGVGMTGWCNTIGACLNAPNNGNSNIGLFCLFMSTRTSVNPRYAIIDGKTTGNYSVTATGIFTKSSDIPDISTKVSKSGDTMTGALSFNADMVQIVHRNNSSWYCYEAYETAGNEAMVYATQQGKSSFIWVNGEDRANVANNRWQSLIPGLQIKNNCVSIGKLIENDVMPSYKLEVNGVTKSTAFDGNLKYTHTNEINFGGGNQSICYFNYRNADTEQAAAVSSMAYKFCNYSNDTSKSNILAGYFNGYTIGKSVPSNAVFSDANVAQTNTTGNAAYRVLYSVNADDADRVEGARKGRIYFNPSNGMFWASNGTNQFQIGNNYLYLNGKITLIQAGNQQLTISATTSASGETNYRVALGVYNNAWTFKPFTDKSLTLGQSSERWGQIYSSNSAISTSDRKEKKDIVSLDEFARTLIMSLNPVSYKFKDGDSGRTHYGMIAQDVEDSLEELGITAIDIAAFCKDKKLKDIPVFSGQRDSKGNPIYDKKQVPIPGEYVYGLRYEEFIAPIIKTEQLQQEDINSLKEEISLLKEEIALLKQRLKILEDK